MKIKIMVLWNGHGDQAEIDLKDCYLFSEVKEIEKVLNIENELPAQLLLKAIQFYIDDELQNSREDN